MSDYPLHPGQTEMPPQFVQLPLENYDAISKELDELRTHEVEWDLSKARIKELESTIGRLNRELSETKAMLEQRNADVARLMEQRDALVSEADSIDARR